LLTLQSAKQREKRADLFNFSSPTNTIGNDCRTMACTLTRIPAPNFGADHPYSAPAKLVANFTTGRWCRTLCIDFGVEN